MKKYNVLVFPCGSEIGLEIFRSLKYSIHVNLIGASSIDDHGKFVYPNYIPNIPFYTDSDFIPAIKKIIIENNIDAIYPAMDSVITKLSEAEEYLGCKVIGSPLETTQVCLSKTKTYNVLKNTINIPTEYKTLKDVKEYPVFMKPEIGYGSRGAKCINNFDQGVEHLISYPTCIILEYLTGKEYTVDCFTNKNRELLFSKPRIRNRITNGISVSTMPVTENLNQFKEIAHLINEKIHFRGAWFFQVKENKLGKLYLLEVASRLGGSSSLFRALGVNFALLSIFDAFGHNVNAFYNDCSIEMDRALDNKYKIELSFHTAYIDFDDCLLLGNIVNAQLIMLLYQFINEGKKIILITKHERDIHQSLGSLRLSNLFDEIIHLEKHHFKYEYMTEPNSIFIDDSYAERFQAHQKIGIPVFAPDAIECLLN